MFIFNTDVAHLCLSNFAQVMKLTSSPTTRCETRQLSDLTTTQPAPLNLVFWRGPFKNSHACFDGVDCCYDVTHNPGEPRCSVWPRVTHSKGLYFGDTIVHDKIKGHAITRNGKPQLVKNHYEAGNVTQCACCHAVGHLRRIDCFPLWSLWLIAVVALTTRYICVLCVYACK